MWGDNEFNSTFSSPGGNANKEARKTLIRHVVPVTGQTIHLATPVENENSVFEYNHLKFHQVCFVGIIRNVIKRANDITYLIDDMTSPEVNVKLQADEADDMESEEMSANAHSSQQFIENQYVKVYGIVKSLQGQKCLQAFKIMPVKEYNEITYHMLSCMNASIYMAKKVSGDAAGMDNPMKSFGSKSSAASSKALLGGDLNHEISEFIKQCKNEDGLHISEVAAAFSNISEAKIRNALEFLSTEGHIYSTVDDEHFRTTDFTA